MRCFFVQEAFRDPHGMQSIVTQLLHSSRTFSLVSSWSFFVIANGFFIRLLATSMGRWSISMDASRSQAMWALLFVPMLVLVQRQPQRWTGPCNP